VKAATGGPAPAKGGKVTEPLVREETAAAFFKEQLEKAMEHQKISTSAFTEYYLVNLLAHRVYSQTVPDPEPVLEETPLALLYVRAVRASQFERARLLRAMGDMALFVCGFFEESLAGKIVDLHYYRSMGGLAYSHLSQQPSPFGHDVFGELAQRFVVFADLFSEVSEASRLTSNQSVVQLYERWAQTGSPRSARLLADKGITPVPEGGGTLQ
jgi:hypothetical protein